MGTQRAIAKPVIEAAVAAAKPVRSHERQALFDAIRARDAQLQAVKEAEQAAARVDALVRDAQAKLMQASTTAKAMREQHSERIALAAKTNTALPSGSASRAAIQHELEASDDLESTKKAAAISMAALEAVQKTLLEAEAKVAATADQVIRAEAHEPLRRAILAKRAELSQLLAGAKFLEREGEFWTYADGTLNLFPTKPAKHAMLSACAVDFQDLSKLPTYLRWAAARQALRSDPDAPLPLPDATQFSADTDNLPAQPGVSPAVAMVMVGAIREANEAAE